MALGDIGPFCDVNVENAVPVTEDDVRGLGATERNVDLVPLKRAQLWSVYALQSGLVRRLRGRRREGRGWRRLAKAGRDA